MGRQGIDDPNYLAGTKALASHPNAQLLGYVHTSTDSGVTRCNVPWPSITADIRKWSTWTDRGVPIRGIFIDEAPNDSANDCVGYMRNLTDFIRNDESLKFGPAGNQRIVVFNPGGTGALQPYYDMQPALIVALETCFTAYEKAGEEYDQCPRAGGGHYPKTEPFTLEDQILASCAHVQHIATTLLSSARPFDEVILTGHSQWTETRPDPAHALLDRSVHHLARGLVALVPDWALGTVLRRVMRFPEHAAAATLRFITSRDGIWQALHMGKDEMRTITEERDEFIEKRRRHEKGRTKVVIDEAGIPHAFCIHHSEAVSEKVKTWIEDIAGL
ncbi:hypothetical protein N0V88_002155 [Collariella sp. IMI 366227]|nr:hypothetical protein N0V88_002155 [Collariella sp. IMI 366227]